MIPMNPKQIFYLLKQLNQPYEWYRSFQWSKTHQYLTYLPYSHIIIDVESDNIHLDKLKKHLATKHNIKHYITNTEEVLDVFKIDLNDIELPSDKDFIIELYKTKMKVRYISRMLKMNHSEVRRIIKEYNNSV